jgi:hypothetical protein
MEIMPVVVAPPRVGTKVFHRFWAFIGKKFDVDISECCVNRCSVGKCAPWSFFLKK